MSDYSNAITFIVPTYESDFHKVPSLIERLMFFYPSSEIIVMADGINWHDELKRDEFEQIANRICSNLRVKLRWEKERIKYIKYGGKWTKRLLNYYRENCYTPILIKVEPDIIVNKPLTMIPGSCDLFGTLSDSLEGDNTLQFIRGGLVGFWATAVRRILDSNLLDSEAYKSIGFSYDRYGKFARKDETPRSEDQMIDLEMLMSCQDRILGHVCKMLQLKLYNWEECNIQFRKPVERASIYSFVSSD